MAYYYAFMMKVAIVQERETLSEALKDPRWVVAMKEEMEALCKNETWDLVPDTPHKKAIGCQWIYKVKHNADFLINRLKARLVAKGYAQTHGIDYGETFAPVAKMTTVRTIIAMIQLSTRFRIERSSKRHVSFQEASLRPQTSTTCVALEDNVVSSSYRISNVKI